jgi:hypothetical protein
VGRRVGQAHPGDACRLQIPYCPHSVGEPLVDWQEGEALARRRRARGQALDHTGLDEVWLAGATVIEQADLATKISSLPSPVSCAASGRDVVPRG